MNRRVRSTAHFSFSSVHGGKILSEKFVSQLYDHIDLILVLSAGVLGVSANADKCPLWEVKRTSDLIGLWLPTSAKRQPQLPLK
jgi:hypothetical protein